MLSVLLMSVIAYLICISQGDDECSLERIQDQKNMCIPTNVTVYQESSSNEWLNWLGVVTSIIGSLNPYIAIIDHAVTITSEIVGSSQSNADVAFQDAVNDEINRLRKCISQQIIEGQVDQLKATLFNFIEPD